MFRVSDFFRFLGSGFSRPDPFLTNDPLPPVCQPYLYFFLVDSTEFWTDFGQRSHFFFLKS
eukprot:NODE_3295_length_387_cov_30.281065_g2637_i0.p1 GENE.NODE_3295_length_387_cov_30.281065_g2637_i0~~NODE_3295_length_387_cov_30.281065_g2637_i0.p1  ORF type:complete len:61 (-),score=5.16 NODE_3295_length_387_cov_30.281065_g2637_i0:171-353(-)